MALLVLPVILPDQDKVRVVKLFDSCNVFASLPPPTVVLRQPTYTEPSPVLGGSACAVHPGNWELPSKHLPLMSQLHVMIEFMKPLGISEVAANIQR